MKLDRRYMSGWVIVVLLFAVVAYGQLAKYTCTQMSPKMCSMGTCQKGYECTLYKGSCNCIPSGGTTTTTTSTSTTSVLPNCPSGCGCMTEEDAKKKGYVYCGGKKNLCGYDQYMKPMYCYETSTTTTTTTLGLDECPGKCECMTREDAKKKNYEYCKGEKILCGHNQQQNEMYCHQEKEEDEGETPEVTVSYTPYSLTTESSVTFNVMALDDGEVKRITIYLNGKEVKKCRSPEYNPDKGYYQCSYSGGPFSQGTMTVYATAVDINKNIGISTEIQVEIIPVPEDGGGVCPIGCECLTGGQAHIVFGADIVICDSTPCGSEGGGITTTVGGGGLVVETPGGGMPDIPTLSIPKYCYRAADEEEELCPGGCECLPPSTAMMSDDLRFCDCSIVSCGSGNLCYETGCVTVSGLLRPFTPEDKPYLMVIAENLVDSTILRAAIGIPLNISYDDPYLTWSVCLAKGNWMITPDYNPIPVGCPCTKTGEWHPEDFSISLTDLCMPPVHQNFYYMPPETIKPGVNISITPETLDGKVNATVTVHASDTSGIKRIRLFQSGLLLNCSPAEEIMVRECCFPPGETEVECVYEGGNYSNFTKVKFHTVVCDRVGNYGEAELKRYVFQNIPYQGPYGELCRCGNGSSFYADFTHWDWLDSGNVLGDEVDEIVFVKDDDQQAYIYDKEGSLLKNFPVSYTHYDRMTIGDVTGDSMEEIVIVCDDDEKVYVYDAVAGALASNFTVNFQRYDGFASGDVLGGGKDEIIIASQNYGNLYIYDGSGAVLSEHPLPVYSQEHDTLNYTYNYSYVGSRYTQEHSRDDAFLVGDVVDDEKEEIIFGIQTQEFIPSGGGGMFLSPVTLPPEIFIHDGDMNLLTTIREVEFSRDNDIIAGDVSGDEKEELLISDHDSWLIYVYTPEFQLQKMHYVTFTKYDGFAAGDVDGSGKDEILIAIDEDRRIYIEGEPTPPGAVITPTIVLSEFPLLRMELRRTLTPANIISELIRFRGIIWNLTPIEPTPKPDLRITSLAVYPARPRIYQPVTVKVEVYNNGTVNSTGEANLTLYWSCHPLTQRIGPLGVGRRREITFHNALIFLEADRNDIVAMIDSGFEIPESNETNNNYTVTVESVLSELMEEILPPSDLGDEPTDQISCPENSLMEIGRNKTPGGDFYRNSTGHLIRDPGNTTIWLLGQGPTNACGTTSLAYILRYLLDDDTYTHERIDEDIRASWVGDAGMFSDPLSLADYVPPVLNAELYNNGNFDEVKEFIDRGIPVMLVVSIDGSGDVFRSHWIVVVNYCSREKSYPPGATEQVIGIYNPWGYQYEIPEERLDVYWGSMDLGGNPLWNKLFIAISDQSLPAGDTAGISNELATAQALSEFFNGLDDIGDGFERIFTEGRILEGLGDIVEGLGTTAVGIVNTIVGFLAGTVLGFWGYADDIPMVGGFLTAAEEFVGDILDVSGDLVKSLADLLGHWYDPSKLAEFFVALGNAIVGIFEAIGELIVNIFKAIGDFFKDLWELLKKFTCWAFNLGCPEMHCKTRYIASIDPCGETITYINEYVREGALGYIHTRSGPGLNPLYLYMETDFDSGGKDYFLSIDHSAHAGRENFTRVTLLGYVNTSCGCTDCCVDLTAVVNDKGMYLDTGVGFLPKFKEPGTDKLWLFRNDASGEYAVSRDPCAGTRTFSSQVMEGHTRDSFLGYINLNEVPGSVKMYRYWNPDTEEFFLSLDPNESDDGFANTGSLGYVYRDNLSGTVPLYDYTGVGSKELVNLTILCEPVEEYRYRRNLVGYIHKRKDNACVAELWRYCRRDIWYA